jgi:hypothetical protein
VTWLKAAIAGLVAVAGAVLAAVGYLATNKWFGSSDLRGMVFWSIPLGVMVFGVVFLLRQALTRFAYGWQYMALVPLGALLGIGWGVAAAFILGGWIFAFSFPVFFCWLAGGLTGGVVAAWACAPRTWPLALALLALIGVGNVRLNSSAQAPPPRLRVYVKPHASRDEVQRVWDEVLGYPRPSGQGGHSLRAGIRSVGIIGYEDGSPVFTVSLPKRMGSTARESLLAFLRSSPLVVRVEIVPDDEPATIRPSVEY